MQHNSPSIYGNTVKKSPTKMWLDISCFPPLISGSAFAYLCYIVSNLTVLQWMRMAVVAMTVVAICWWIFWSNLIQQLTDTDENWTHVYILHLLT